MLKLLIKKQFSEMYAGLFFDRKKNKARSKIGAIIMIILTLVLGAGVIGGLMTMLAKATCEPLTMVGMGWLYFTILGMVGLLAGLLGGAFAAHTHLYKGRDNDTLLSLPISTRDIIASRILSVYITTGGMTILCLLPTLIVYWITTGFGWGKMAVGLLFALSVSLLALVLGCLLGLVVARVSTKMKNRSFVTVLVSLLGMGLYYFFYFKFQDFIEALIQNPESFARMEKIPGLKLFGQAGEGKLIPLLAVAALALLLAAITLYLLVRSFRSLISAADAVSRVKYKEKKSKQKSPLKALLGKECTRLTTSPAYLLNGAMGSIFLILLAGAAVIKGPELMSRLESDGGDMAKTVLVMIASAVIAALAMTNNITSPSVSLEGKQLWILKSVPVEAWSILKGKLGLQLLVSGVPTLLAGLCCGIVLKAGMIDTLFLLLFPQLCVLLFGSLGLMMGLIRPNFDWTNEVVVIKQSLPALITLFGGWFYGGVTVVLYFLFASKLGNYVFMGLVCLVTAALAGLVLLWLKKRGTKRFEAL